MSQHKNECVVESGGVLGCPVTQDVQIVFGQQVGSRVAETGLERRKSARYNVINAKFENAIAVGACPLGKCQACGDEDPAAKESWATVPITDAFDFLSLNFHRMCVIEVSFLFSSCKRIGPHNV